MEEIQSTNQNEPSSASVDHPQFAEEQQEAVEVNRDSAYGIPSAMVDRSMGKPRSKKQLTFSEVIEVNETRSHNNASRSQISEKDEEQQSELLKEEGYDSDDEGSMQSPTPLPRQASVDFSKFKYYSAKKAGFQHLHDENNPLRNSIVEGPRHRIEEDLFVYQLPFTNAAPGSKNSSTVIIFSIWNTMTGTVILSLPWAFQKAGLVTSMIICFVQMLISFYTCYLIVKVAKHDEDFATTVRKYYGMWGYHICQISLAVLLVGTLVTLFTLMSQLTYPVCLAIYTWCAYAPGDESKPEQQIVATWEHFSSAYTALVLYFVVIMAVSKQQMYGYIRMGRFGAIFQCMLIMLLTGTSLYSCTKTNYTIGTQKGNLSTAWDYVNGVRTIVLFQKNVSPLMGMLTVGYYCHTCALPILKTSKTPEKNTQNLFIAYVLCFFGYLLIGALGYIGFIGTPFKKYFIKAKYFNVKLDGWINQNCLDMLQYEVVFGFVLRLAIFLLVFFTYPLLNHYLQKTVLNIFWRRKAVSNKTLIILNILFTSLPLAFALEYAKIGVVLEWTGAIGGFFIVYVLPVAVYMKKLRLEITNPMLAQAIDSNQVELAKSIPDVSPQIAIKTRFLIKNRESLLESGDQAATVEGQQKAGSNIVKWYLQLILHLFIPLYGIFLVCAAFSQEY